MAAIELPVLSIGVLARKLLTEANSASVVGATSRGIFLQIDARWVLFLSCEAYRGPLVLNLSGTAFRPKTIHPGQRVEIINGAVVFPEAQLCAQIKNAVDWAVLPHPRPVLAPPEISHRIRLVAQDVLAERGGVGLGHLLAELLQIPLSETSAQPHLPAPVDIHLLHKNLRTSDVHLALADLQKMIGFGSGLTPSGDDLIGGFLLACNRYRDSIELSYDLGELNMKIVEMAIRKTSRLSANLIECAALGQADERLILALDGILAGTLAPASCARLLLSWGNSSGGDALLGMALAAYTP